MYMPQPAYLQVDLLSQKTGAILISTETAKLLGASQITGPTWLWALPEAKECLRT